jgi:hypothetical protein
MGGKASDARVLRRVTERGRPRAIAIAGASHVEPSIRGVGTPVAGRGTRIGLTEAPIRVVGHGACLFRASDCNQRKT